MNDDPTILARQGSGKWHQPAYLLWLFRQRHVTNWPELCDFFGADPDGRCTIGIELFFAIESLHRAGMIEIADMAQPLRRSILGDNTLGDNTVNVTESASRVLATLEISLADLARSEPRNSMYVSPIFGTPSGEQYTHDLFILMPFAEEMKPIYEDHLKTVAKSLEMSVARADDFFTQESIIEEIWCAIAKSEILVADCTGRNPNVFYEIGMAHSIGKRVILITQNADDIPFDLRHRRFLQYAYTPPGMKEFEEALRETIETTVNDIAACKVT